MAYKIAINNDNNTYTSKLSKFINERLNNLGIESIVLQNDTNSLTNLDVINKINNKYGTGNNVINIYNKLSDNANGIEINYALRNNDILAKKIYNELNSIGSNITKYYQLRNNINTYLDDDPFIRDTNNNQSLIIYLGNKNNQTDINYLNNNIEKIGEAIVRAIASYTNTPYYLDDNNYYIVKKGDNLWSVASKYNTTVDNLKKLNNLSSNILSIGQVLLVKDSNTEVNDTNNIIYTVQKGDSLWLIANKYNTTVDNLKELNNLSSNILSIGQKLIVNNTNFQTDESDNIIYTVKKGDSLWLIANKYNTTVDKIKEANNLSSNTLSINQKIIIPSSSNYIKYTVKKGDNLYSIANKYNTTVNNLKKLNNLNSNTLSIGQVLLIET